MPQIVLFGGFVAFFMVVCYWLAAQLQHRTSAHLYWCVGVGFYGAMLLFAQAYFLFCTLPMMALGELVGLAVGLYWVFKNPNNRFWCPIILPKTTLDELFFVGFLSVIVLPAVAFFSQKNHYWDAFGIWNLHARYL